MEYSALSSSPRAVPAGAKMPAADVHISGVSWAAVFGGAFVMAALSLILLALGTGLGLSAVSPWANTGASASTLRAAAIVWLIAMQLISSAMGGYLSGRLRQRWPSIHTDEVYFRDTAHGFLSWAVATVMTAAFLASAATSLAGGAIQAAGSVAIPQSNTGDPTTYFADMLLRTDHSVTDPNDAAVHTEVGRILTRSLSQQDIAASDRTYLAQLIAARTGQTTEQAEQRVTDVVTQARNAGIEARAAADAARRSAAHASLWIFAGLLVGAFSASLAATMGGRQRDAVAIL